MCRIGPRRLDQEAAFIASYRRMLEDRLNRLEDFLEDLGDGRTRLLNTSLFHTTQERDGMLNSGMEGGLNQSYEALDRVLGSMN